MSKLQVTTKLWVAIKPWYIDLKMRIEKDNHIAGQSDQSETDSLPCWVSSQPQLQEWYASDLGQSILAQLMDRLDHILPTVFGYQGLQRLIWSVRGYIDR